jgi:hypothetical protein
MNNLFAMPFILSSLHAIRLLWFPLSLPLGGVGGGYHLQSFPARLAHQTNLNFFCFFAPNPLSKALRKVVVAP